MKRLWYCAVLTILVGAICIFCPMDTSKRCTDLNRAIDSAVDFAYSDDWDNVDASVSELQQIWQKWLPLAHCYLFHSDLETISSAIITLTEAACTHDRIRFSFAATHLKETIERLKAVENLSFSNIL